MILDEVRHAWQSLATGTRGSTSLSARALAQHPSMLIATDQAGSVHLLLPATGEVPKRAYGAILLAPRLLVEAGVERAFVDVTCTDPALREAFFWLVSEVVRRTEGVGVDTAGLVLILEDFKALFTSRAAMTRSGLLGLIAELDVLERVTTARTGWQALDWWVREAQDFRSEHVCLEVKATESVDGGKVSVHGLGQFTDELPVYLVALRLHESGSEGSVPERVERLAAAGVPRPALTRKVSEVFDPSSPLASQGFTAIDIGWWRVNTDFPFLQPGDLPAHKLNAISEITYSVPVAAFPPEALSSEAEVIHAF